MFVGTVSRQPSKTHKNATAERCGLIIPRLAAPETTTKTRGWWHRIDDAGRNVGTWNWLGAPETTQTKGPVGWARKAGT